MPSKDTAHRSPRADLARSPSLKLLTLPFAAATVLATTGLPAEGADISAAQRLRPLLTSSDTIPSTAFYLPGSNNRERSALTRILEDMGIVDFKREPCLCIRGRGDFETCEEYLTRRRMAQENLDSALKNLQTRFTIVMDDWDSDPRYDMTSRSIRAWGRLCGPAGASFAKTLVYPEDPPPFDTWLFALEPVHPDYRRGKPFALPREDVLGPDSYMSLKNDLYIRVDVDRETAARLSARLDNPRSFRVTVTVTVTWLPDEPFINDRPQYRGAWEAKCREWDRAGRRGLGNEWDELYLHPTVHIDAVEVSLPGIGSRALRPVAG